MCVRGDTKLITRNGIEKIGECADDEKEVEIWNGEEWKKVIPFKTGYDQRFYRVTFSDGSYLDATANHQFAVKNRQESEYRKVNVLDMIEEINNSPYPIHIPRSNIEYDGGYDVTGSYDMGFVLGDATVTKDGRYIFAGIFNETKKDEIVFETKTYVKGPYFSNPNSYVKKENGELLSHNNVYFENLDKEFCSELKLKDGFPREMFSWSKRSILEFMAGWADADGSQASKGIRIYGEESKIRDAQLLLSKCGINSSVNLMQRKGSYVSSFDINRKNDVWYLQITKTSDIPCQRLTCDNDEEAKFKGKHQTIKNIELIENTIEDSYCLHEESRNMCVFNNVLTYQCNLSTINGIRCNNVEAYLNYCKAASILGTLQAGYTNFTYIDEASKDITDREALLGVSITGWMNNPDVLFDEQNMRNGAEEVKKWNAIVADLIGINHAARTTCTKPEGNSSVILGSASGIHGEHAPMYFRNVQMNEMDEALHAIMEQNPKMVEDSVWSSTGTDKVVSFPVTTKEGSMYKDQLLGVKQLEYVKKAQQNWVEYGTRPELCVDPTLRHNVSNTITVDDWEEVADYIYDNRKWFAGISLLSAFGDKAYPQAPFMEVHTGKEIFDKYGEASMFASGLIVDGLHAFNNNLWQACETVCGWGLKLDPESSEDLLKRDWVRRAKKFAENYFSGFKEQLSPNDILDGKEPTNHIIEMTNCLKDCHNLHKWKKIQTEMVDVDFVNELTEKTYTDVDTLGAQACSGGKCDISLDF